MYTFVLTFRDGTKQKIEHVTKATCKGVSPNNKRILAIIDENKPPLQFFTDSDKPIIVDREVILYHVKKEM